MEEGKGSTMGPKKQIKRAFKRTMVKLKSRSHSSGESSNEDTRRHHLQTSRSEMEEHPLRPSEDEYKPQNDSLEASWEKVSEHSASPHALPDSPLPFRRPQGPPPQGRTRSSSRGTEEFLRVEAPEGESSRDRAQFPGRKYVPDALRASYMASKDGTQETTGGSNEREELRATLSAKLRQGQTYVDVGEYLVKNYRDRDSVLEGQVTRLVADNESLAVIASVVLASLDLNPPPLGFTETTQPDGSPSPSDSFLFNGPRSAPEQTDVATTTEPHVTTSTQDQESSPGSATSARPPVSNKNIIIPYRPFGTKSAPLPAHFQSTSEVRVPSVPLVAPRPRRPAPAVPRWTESVIARIQSELAEHEADLSRREEESSNEARQAGDNTNNPIVGRATIERVKRGYYDERVDERAPLPNE